MSVLLERFLRYVKFDTKSNEELNSVPSTKGQLEFAKELAEELKNIGLQEITLDEFGYIMATLPANIQEQVPVLGFIAHMDTAPDMDGVGEKARVIEKYDGEDIVLNEDLKVILSPKDFPELKNYQGQTLITTDGNTLLGADDKAGIAEIVTALEYLIKHPEIPHGNIRVGFTPDEEIGRGADHFDVAKFKADYAYTMDGGPIGELEFENFNAAEAKITFYGRNVHPGTAKGKMINSMLLANELVGMLPAKETPAHTEGYEGFYHLTSIKGDVEKTTVQLIIRDFNQESFTKRKKYLESTLQILSEKYPQVRMEIKLKDQYYNMREKIEPVYHIIEKAANAMESLGIKPIIKPIRGGTDGARLSYMGLPTPNIFAGGHNFHGKYEFIPLESMEKAVEVIIAIIKNASKE
jgi:tripeptide aminopeptidase